MSRMWLRAWVVCAGLGVLGAQAQCTTPDQAAVLDVKLGRSGMPPAFVYPGLPAGATDAQIEVWKDGTLFAQVTASAGFLWVRIQENGVTKTNGYLRDANGPDGYRLFAAGAYQVKWRGYNACGYGAWSAETPFTVTHTGTLSVRITRGPGVVGSSGDIAFSWSNNFASTKYQIQIRRGTKVVRSYTGTSSYGYAMEFTGSYADHPLTPAKELGNASYVFRVRVWSPILRKYSAWKSKAFRIARGLPRRPVLSFTQRDFNGFFTRSPRPFFYANYGKRSRTPVWSVFDVRKKVGNRLQPVFYQWVRRDTAGLGSGILAGSKMFFGGAGAFADLSAGTYVWRVGAWNGRGANQSRWSAVKTSVVKAAAKPASPTADGFALFHGSRYTFFTWRAVPNAYTYSLGIVNKTTGAQSFIGVDPRLTPQSVGIGRTAAGQVVVQYIGQALAPGNYQFYLQAANKAASGTRSEWSPPIPSANSFYIVH